jgi:hypothetical protein
MSQCRTRVVGVQQGTDTCDYIELCHFRTTSGIIIIDKKQSTTKAQEIFNNLLVVPVSLYYPERSRYPKPQIVHF